MIILILKFLLKHKLESIETVDTLFNKPFGKSSSHDNNNFSYGWQSHGRGRGINHKKQCTYCHKNELYC